MFERAPANVAPTRMYRGTRFGWYHVRAVSIASWALGLVTIFPIRRPRPRKLLSSYGAMTSLLCELSLSKILLQYNLAFLNGLS